MSKSQIDKIHDLFKLAEFFFSQCSFQTFANRTKFLFVAVCVDTAPLTSNCHLFGTLKLMCNAVNAKTFDEFKLSARRAMEIGAINGARALGIDRWVGSFTPGKRADLIMVRTEVITMGVFTDPTRMIIEPAEPSTWTP